MITLLPPDPRRRFGAVLLLSLLLVLATGLSLSGTLRLETQASAVLTAYLPPVKDVHGLAAAVDDARGMAALHILLRNAADVAEIEARLAARRQQIDHRMTLFGRRLVDDTERSHHQRVLVSLAAYWAVQDRLLAASRRAAADPAAAELSRALLTGESQQAFQQLVAEIDAWAAYTEQLVERAATGAARQSRSAVWLALAPLLLSATLLWLAALRWRVDGRAASPSRSTEALRAELEQRLRNLDTLAHQTHLMALNAAVLAARSGEPSHPLPEAAPTVRQLASQVARQAGTAAAEIKALAQAHAPGAPTAGPG